MVTVNAHSRRGGRSICAKCQMDDTVVRRRFTTAGATNSRRGAAVSRPRRRGVRGRLHFRGFSSCPGLLGVLGYCFGHPACQPRLWTDNH